VRGTGARGFTTQSQYRYRGTAVDYRTILVPTTAVVDRPILRTGYMSSLIS
jgi:hypothetical protein